VNHPNPANPDSDSGAGSEKIQQVPEGRLPAKARRQEIFVAPDVNPG